MKKRTSIFLNILQVSSFVLLTMMSSGAEAKISPTAFNKICRYFKEDEEWLSPIFGQGALDSGLIHNLRFYGDFESGQEGGQRNYILDKSRDPTWKLIKALFPSPSGHLTPETSSKTNFSSYATPAVIAVLLNYVNFLQEKKEKNTKTSMTKQDVLPKILELIASKKEKVNGLKIQQVIVEFVKNNTDNIKDKNKKIQLENALLLSLKELNLGITGAESTKIITALQKSSIVELNTIFDICQNQLFKGKSQAILEVLTPIDQSILQEGKKIYIL